jgi:N-acetylmuramic acid 6-phosphate etherase
MPNYVIGINGGGTHTDLLLADETLKPLARAEVGPTNLQNVGLESVRLNLETGIREVLQAAGLTIDAIVGIGAGISGIDRPTEHLLIQRIFEAIAPRSALQLDNDAVPALVAGAGRRFGVVVISGTGQIAYGFDEQGARARSGGWGNLIDPGSGYVIGREILGAIMAEYDGTGSHTALTGRVLLRLGLKSPEDLMTWMYAPERGIDSIAALAAEALHLGGSDPVATEIISRGAEALSAEARAVARRLSLKAFPLVLSGGMFKYSALMRDLVALRVQDEFPGALAVHGDHDAALGAAIMALETLGAALPQPPFDVQPTERSTERRNPLTMQASQQSPLAFLSMMNIEDFRVAGAVRAQIPAIAALIEAAAPCFEAGGRVFYVGAGTSGRLGVLDAVECLPTFSTDQIVGVMAGGKAAVVDSIETAEDSESAGREAIVEQGVTERDIVIGIAASGRTPYVMGALREAGARKALTACIVNTIDAPIARLVKHPIVILTGAEALTGSTRLKAGTAAKLVLNMISTGLMVAVGHTYDNLMTDMQTSNLKLGDRARRIVAQATGLESEAAADLLARAEGEIKTAIVAARLNISIEQARAQLATHKGKLARTIAVASQP